jgi:outer membrane protein OmpA-like peptidoglycan-associated protein
MHRLLFGAFAPLFLVSGAFASSDVPIDCQEGPSAEWPAITVVHFDTGKTALRPSDKHFLDALAARLAGNGGVQVCILGQADKQGSEEKNRKLSLARAEAVGQYLAGRGVPQRQHLYGWRGEAFGGSDVFGLFDGDEAEGEQKDRRVEVFVVGHGQQGKD